MPPVTEHDVRNIAALARLGVDDARVPDLVRELNSILVHMDALQSVSVSLTDLPDSRIDGMPLRQDVVNPVPLQLPRESFAPLMRDGFFLVPRLDTHGDATSASTEASRDD